MSGSLMEIDVDGGGPGNLHDNGLTITYKQGYSSGFDNSIYFKSETFL